MQDKQPQDENFIPLETLTPRELEVLALLAERLSNAEIAERLILARSTVKGYTREIYSKLAVNSRQAAIDRARQLGLLAETRPQQPPSNNLPAEITPFIGREREVEQVISLFHDQACRVVTLFGPGGIGKTRLALQVARRLIEQATNFFPNGVYFISLFSLSEAAFIPQAISSVFNIEFEEADDNQKQLLQFLRKKHLLLVLDNLEHLWNEVSAQFLGKILSVAPGVNLLVTSRERLNLHGEQSFSLPGLEVPTEDQLRSEENSSLEAEKFSSIHLFVQSARRANPQFQLKPEQVPDVIRICHLLGGLPLGIEMAAAWIPVLSPTQILAEIRSGLDFLEAETYGIPKRQRRLILVLESSWKRLSEAERTGVKALSVFPGSLDLSTARQIHRITPDLLRSLVNKSWLQPIEQGRFQMHALLHQYASERLAGDPELRNLFNDRLSRYFCEFLERLDADWSGPRQSTAIAEIKREIDNIRAAWKWASEHCQIDLLARGRYSLETFYEWTGLQTEAEASFQRAVSYLLQQWPEQSTSDADILLTLAQLLTSQSHFTVELEASIRLLERSESVLMRLEQQSLDVRSARAQVLERYGQHWSLMDRKRARAYYEQSYALYQEMEDTTSMSRLLDHLGWINRVTGDYEHSRQLSQENLKLLERRGDQRGMGNTLNNLGFVAKHLGELDEAVRLQREGLACMRRAGADKDVARLLYDLSATLIWMGEFDEAMQKIKESRKINENIGLVAEHNYQLMIGIALLMGHYAQAEEWAMQEMAEVKAASRMQQYGFIRWYAGVAALGLGKLDMARDDLIESYTVLASLQQDHFVMPKIELAYVERAQENLLAAWKCLQESFPHLLATRSFLLLMHALPIIALLLLDQGETEQAVKLYALARRYAYIRNSRRFHDFAGEELDREAAKLEKERLAELLACGQDLDLWQTAKELHAAIPIWTSRIHQTSKEG